MDAQQIKVFIDAMAASGLAEMEVAHNGWTLRLLRDAVPLAPDAWPPAFTAPTAATVDGAHEQCAPLGGVVFLHPAPEAPPFVQPGQTVQAGQVLCVIEAMKVFNEVPAERAGVVEALLIASGQEVDAGQPLLRLR